MRQLVLANTPTTDVHLDHLRSTLGLERLDLSGTRISDEGIEKIANLPLLHDLALDRTGITDRSLKRLGTMRLQQLTVGNTRITDQGIKQLAQRQGAGDYLNDLDLTGTAISDASIPSLISMHRLNRLAIAGTKLTDEGVKHLKMALPKCQVER